MRGLPQKQNARRADKIRLCGHLRRYKKIVKKTYIIYNKPKDFQAFCGLQKEFKQIKGWCGDVRFISDQRLIREAKRRSGLDRGREILSSKAKMTFLFLTESSLQMWTSVSLFPESVVFWRSSVFSQTAESLAYAMLTMIRVPLLRKYCITIIRAWK